MCPTYTLSDPLRTNIELRLYQYTSLYFITSSLSLIKVSLPSDQYNQGFQSLCPKVGRCVADVPDAYEDDVRILYHGNSSKAF